MGKQTSTSSSGLSFREWLEMIKELLIVILSGIPEGEALGIVASRHGVSRAELEKHYRNRK